MITAKSHPYNDEIKFDWFTFPGGEEHVRLTDVGAKYIAATIRADIYSSADVMTLLLLTDALRDHGVKEINLIMPYVPYARQDRIAVDGEAHSLRVFTNIINAEHYDEVEVWDPHSDVATALLNNCRAIPCSGFVSQIPLDMTSITMVAPDAGAAKKVMAAARRVGAHFLQATKIRSVITGEITGTEVHGVLHHSNHYLIVDDICDGGRTFTELAELLKQSSAKVDLYVTHGIFSRGFAVFDRLIDTIYCANPWPHFSESHNRIKI